MNLETVPSKMALEERPDNLEFESGSGGYGQPLVII